MQKIPRFLARNGNFCNFGLFFLNLLAMATPLAPLKISIAYLKSPTQKPDFSCEKVLNFLHTTEICAILAYFCLNLVVMATPLAPLKFWIAYLNSPTPKTLLFLRKVLDFLCRLKSVQFWLIFVQIWLPWQLPWLP